MCFMPQGCAPFWHLNIQKWSETNSFYLFQLRNALRATTARNFPTSQHPKVLREWGVFNMLTSMCNIWTSQRPKVLRHWGAFSFLTSKSASRHNCVQFFIAHPAASLRNKTLEKQCFATYLPFAHLDLLSTDSFSSLPFSSNSYCSHPCCCISKVGNLTFKHPSVMCSNFKNDPISGLLWDPCFELVCSSIRRRHCKWWVEIQVCSPGRASNMPSVPPCSMFGG